MTTGIKRAGPAVLALVLGAAVGHLLTARAAPAPPPLPYDFASDVTVYRPGAPNLFLRPYHIMQGSRSRVVGSPPPNADDVIWVLSFDQGRLRLACVEVGPPPG
jgi:hypothetical protein